MSTQTGTDLINQAFPIDGPHTADTAIDAAAAIAELWRYLGHAIIGGTRNLLADPADAYTVVGLLSDADRRASDVLERLARYAVNVGDASTYTDHFGHDDPDGSPDQIQAGMHQAATELRLAGSDHDWGASRLDRAAGWLSHIYRNTTSDEGAVLGEEN
ncbi:hypothetical protein APR11_000037 [Nocardia amikacinitolerans]|uniref:hypothetical protein n=1 Tax=Nocardia amikacinitolerans TaxID=756689 RepID=UPI0020A4482B|nr:hypothetical protein [Nocardia amikacinitolerans]MCP2293633.1 hypothetical protein [Nocardia amikacinitolerans]